MNNFQHNGLVGRYFINITYQIERFCIHMYVYIYIYTMILNIVDIYKYTEKILENWEI